MSAITIQSSSLLCPPCPPVTFHEPLNTRKNSRDIVRGTPAILEDIQAEFAGGVDVGMEHLADELDRGRLVGILFFEMHHESKGSVFEWSIGGSNNDGIPDDGLVGNPVR